MVDCCHHGLHSHHRRRRTNNSSNSNISGPGTTAATALVQLLAGLFALLASEGSTRCSTEGFVLAPPSISKSCLFPSPQSGGDCRRGDDDRWSRRRRRTRAAFVAALHNNNDNVNEVDDAVGVYVHIPYCRRRCRYCDFAIVPVGGDWISSEEMTGNDGGLCDDDNNASAAASRAEEGFRKMDEVYTRAVVDEIKLIHQKSQEKKKIPLRSIYFGGGTPSLAPPETLIRIVAALIDPDTGPFYIPDPSSSSTMEMTIEMDPGTFNLPKLRAVQLAGFNRISLGAQSFDDATLEGMGRAHRVRDIHKSIDLIHEVYGNDEGVKYSLDLISGAPGMTLAEWADTLAKATAMRPKPSHLSLYDLQIEEGTAFGRWYKDQVDRDDDDDDDDGGLVATPSPRKSLLSSTTAPPTSLATSSLAALPTPDECAFMYRYASAYLRSKGYEHYEISSYALLDDHDDGRNIEYSGTSSNPQPPRCNNSRNNSSNPNRAQHNQIYWKPNASWYAVGLGASSTVNGKRYSRPRNMADYCKWVADMVVDQGQLELKAKVSSGAEDEEHDAKVEGGDNDNDGTGKSSASMTEWIPPWLPNAKNEADTTDDVDESDDDDDALLDIVMTRLRTSEGLDLDMIANRVRHSHGKKEGEKVVKKILRGFAPALELKLGERLHCSTDDGDGDGGEENDDQSHRGDDGGSLSLSYGIIRLKDPDGFLFSNTMISNIFVELDDRR